MKLQLDTAQKTIKVEEDVKLSKLISIVKRMFPNGEWQDFTLRTNTVIEHWSSPIIFHDYYPVPQRRWYDAPWVQPYYASNQKGMVGLETDNSMSLAVGKLNGSNQAKAMYKVDNSPGLTDKSEEVTYELKPGIFNIKI